MTSATSLLKTFLTPRKIVSDTIGYILIALLTPTFEIAKSAEDRNSMSRELTILALGLARYHHDRGTYPESLSELKPKYATAIPLELFSGQELIYKTSGPGYMLYSVGENGQDDGGKSFNDQPAGDDLTVRLSP